MREKRVLSRLIHEVDFALFNSHYSLTIHPPCQAGLFSWIAMQYNAIPISRELPNEASPAKRRGQVTRSLALFQSTQSPSIA